MSFISQPWHILLATLYGWVNQRQQQMIEFQNDRIEVLLKKVGKKRLLIRSWSSRFTLSQELESNTPQRIRTSNLRFRRPMLYPIELGVQLRTPIPHAGL